MKPLLQHLRDFQPVLVALILLLAVVVYCLFNRYDLEMTPAPANGISSAIVIDHLTGRCHRTNGKLIAYQ